MRRLTRKHRVTQQPLDVTHAAVQRCYALRLLCFQEEVADCVLHMIIGAAEQLKVGDPGHLATHVGPVIDAEAKGKMAG